MRLNLRRWTLSDKDVAFTLSIRNNPTLMQYFRQDEPITEYQQRAFIEYDLIHHKDKYFGHIIELNDLPIGMCNVAKTGEFGLAILPEYCTDLLIRRTLDQMGDGILSPVFKHDPRLGLYLYQCGFKVSRVEERAYYKKDFGLVDVIEVKR